MSRSIISDLVVTHFFYLRLYIGGDPTDNRGGLAAIVVANSRPQHTLSEAALCNTVSCATLTGGLTLRCKTRNGKSRNGEFLFKEMHQVQEKFGRCRGT